MDEVSKKHRQEQKELQARITQKKKSATKKTRKGVNDECAELERQLQHRQNAELVALSGDSKPDDVAGNDDGGTTALDIHSVNEAPTNGLNRSMGMLSVSNGEPGNGRSKKPNRQKARRARRAAEQERAVDQAAKEAADLPNLRAKESESMQQQYTKLGLMQHEIRSDGHCLFAAVADQLVDNDLTLKPGSDIDGLDQEVLSPLAPYKATREVAASYIVANADDFMPFLEEPLESYVYTIRNTGEWGGHVELLALARAYGRDINVLHSSGEIDQIESGSQSKDSPLWLAYYRHNFGLGEHYNSLRRVP